MHPREQEFRLILADWMNVAPFSRIGLYEWVQFNHPHSADDFINWFKAMVWDGRWAVLDFPRGQMVCARKG